MAKLNLDQELLSLDASANVGDVAETQARAALNFKASAEINCGLNLELGIGVMARLNAEFSKYVAAGIDVSAFAEAGLKGQVQAPLDLFSEAGMAVRLQAYARAGVSAKLFVGLSMGDFIQQAQQDPNINGLYLKLLIIFLEEFEIKAGVNAQAAFSAMAFGNFVITGRLVKDEVANIEPGFTIAGSFGTGLKGGAGVEMFANFGIKDPGRWMQRSIDVTVDETVSMILQQLDPGATTERTVTRALRAPAKIALRTAFEIGVALAENSSAISNAGDDMMKRSIMIIMEELQRALIEAIVSKSLEELNSAFVALGFDEDSWENAQPQRQYLADKLKLLPSEPFDLDYVQEWAEIINAASSLGLQLAGSTGALGQWKQPIALLWSAIQLAMVGWDRITSAQARVTLLGSMSASQKLDAFKGDINPLIPAPEIIKEAINSQLGRANDAVIMQEDIVAFIIDVGFDALIQEKPELAPVLEIIAGPGADPTALASGASVILNNAGAFVPDDNGKIDQELTLRALVDGLQAYMNVRMTNELVPALYEITEQNPELKMYIDEVIMPSMRFSIDTIFNEVLNWSFGRSAYSDALSKACTSILMKITGRSVVVTSDILFDHVLRYSKGELLKLADQVDDPGGIAEQIATNINEDKEFVGEIMHDSIEIAAEVIGPFSPERRSRIRHALYSLFDILPQNPDIAWLDEITGGGCPPSKTMTSLSTITNEMTDHLIYIVRLFWDRVLTKLGVKAWEFIEETMDEWIAEISNWADDMAAAVSTAYQRLLLIPGEIAQYFENITGFLVELTQNIITNINNLISSIGSSLSTNITNSVYPLAELALFSNLSYIFLSQEGKKAARDELKRKIESLVNNTIVQNMLQPLHTIVTNADEFVEEIVEAVSMEIENNSELDIQSTLENLLQNKLLDSMNVNYNVDVITATINLDFSFSYPSYNPIEMVETSVSFDIDIEIDVPDFSDDIIGIIRDANSFDDLVSNFSDYFMNYFDTLQSITGLRLEQDMLQIQHDQQKSVLDEATLINPGISILSPQHDSLLKNNVKIRALFSNIPESFFGRVPESKQRVLVILNDKHLYVEHMNISPANTKQVETISNYVNLSVAYFNGNSSRKTAINKKPKGDINKSRGNNPLYIQPELTSPNAQSIINSDYLDAGLLVPLNNLLLEYDVPPAEIIEGLNTLTILVSDGKATPVQETVVFLHKEENIIPDRTIEIPEWDFTLYEDYAKKDIVKNIRIVKNPDKSPQPKPGKKKPNIKDIIWNEKRALRTSKIKKGFNALVKEERKQSALTKTRTARIGKTPALVRTKKSKPTSKKFDSEQAKRQIKARIDQDNQAANFQKELPPNPDGRDSSSLPKPPS